MAGAASFWSRVGRDPSGAAAVEFALLAPLLIGLYFGMAEYCQAMLADRKATHVASSIGDLVAQTEAITATEIDDIFTIGPSLVTPFPQSGLKLRVTSVVMSSTNTPEIKWTRAWTGGAAAAYNVSNLPTTGANSSQPFLAAGQSVIVSQAEYSYTSPFDLSAIRKLLTGSSGSGSGASTYTFKEVFYLRPRKSDTIPCTGC